MKKTVQYILLLIFLCACLVSCGKENNKIEGEHNPNDEATQNGSEEAIENAEDVENDENWGVEENIITEKEAIKARAYIKFPFLAGITEGQGKIAYQTDNTLVILGSEIDFEKLAVEDNKTENVFPAYFQKVKGIVKTYRRANYQNFEFEISEKELVTVNDYEMCKYTGQHTFTIDGQPKSIAYVAYATKMKANDAVVYWMVLDESEDQSLGSTIESHAKKMAESFHE